MRHPLMIALTVLAVGCVAPEDPIYPRCRNADTQCPGTLICEATYCVAPPNVVDRYGVCTDDEQCPGESTCRKGVCIETVTVTVPATPLQCGVKLFKFKLPNTPIADPNQPLLFVTAVPTIMAPNCKPVVTMTGYQMTVRSGKGFTPKFGFAESGKMLDKLYVKELGGGGVGGFSGWSFWGYQVQKRVTLPMGGTSLEAWCTSCGVPVDKMPNIDVNILTDIIGLSWEEYENGPLHQEFGDSDIGSFRIF